jgi:hypothetical protein
MPISINNTTLTFNDATTQTTAAVNPIPAGSVMLFYQAAAPTGWTQVTALNDYDLRLVSGTGGGTGGTTAYSTVFTNQTVSTTVSVSGTTGGTTLSESQMPSHRHGFLFSNANPGGPAYYLNTAGTCYTYLNAQQTYNQNAILSVDLTGGNGSHSHSFSGSGSGTSSAVTLNVRYANIIICSKN